MGLIESGGDRYSSASKLQRALAIVQQLRCGTVAAHAKISLENKDVSYVAL